MFPFCMESGKLTADYSGAQVVSVTIQESARTMNLSISLINPAPPLELSLIEDMITREFDLASVSLTASYARPDISEKSKKAKRNQPIKPGSVIMGKRIAGEPVPVGTVTLESGKAVVRGEVCDVSHKEIEKSGAWILSFDLTDYTGTIHVSKYLKDENAAKIARSVQKGMWITVSGILGVSRKYEGDPVLEPQSIMTSDREKRFDNAEEKRVELHLHTKMSALDAVTDTAGVIRRAAEWGHPAVAITDHGVVHTFPDAAEAVYALENKIKVIYGVEGYFFDDVGYRTAVFQAEGSTDDEFVVFDIETTGLHAMEDRIFEIGAVIVKSGREMGKFHTYADPGVPIPYNITSLTGVRDSDLVGAPSQPDALKAFFAFAADRVLVAHNADFDVGFLYESCRRHGISFSPRYIDTLALARVLLPKLKNHKLETLAAHFGQLSFNHHKADEDAWVTAHIWSSMLKMLHSENISDVTSINDFLSKQRDEGKPGSWSAKGRVSYRHIILLASNKTGLGNLYKLVTKSHLEYFDRYPVIMKSVLMRHRDGLIIGSACEAGEIFRTVTERRSTLELKKQAMFYDFLEIQPISNNFFMLYGEKPLAKNEEELRDFNRRVVDLGLELGKPVVATGDVHFLDPEHEVFRHILLSSKNFESADDNLPLFFRTTEEMLAEFGYLGQEKAYDVVVRNSRLIADMCEFVDPMPPAKKLFLPKLDRSAEDLKELVRVRLSELYGNNPPELITKRLEAEMSDILERNYDIIYMAAQKLVADSMDNGYLVGSRGSIGSSIVAFLAGITEVNALPAHYRCPKCLNSDFASGVGWGCGADMPEMDCPVCGEKYIKDGFNIPFETFLGFDGDKVPDIDLNFSGEYQPQAHRYTADLFGAEMVFRAGTIGTVQEKMAYGYVKKYIEASGRTISKAEENRLARGCVDVKQTTGQHPGGLIIIPQGMEITDFCPAQHPADDVDKGIITTHFDYHRMEDNLIKLDILGHDDPTMLKMLQDLTGVNVREISLDDPETMAIFTSPLSLGLPENDEIIGATGTIGISEFGTSLTRQMLSETKPGDFDTLVRLSGFSHGVDVWVGNARDLVLYGKATIGDTISCRDDIMLFLIAKGMDDRGAFRISENVRKGKGLPDGAEDEMMRCGVPGWYIESCKKITYLFPKAHAAAYVIMAFRIAWFKVHKPLEFYSAYFYRRSQKDRFDAECMTRGIDAARAKINEIKRNQAAKQKDNALLTTLEACYEFYMRGFSFVNIDLYESDPEKFLIVGSHKLRPPFVAVSGLGDAVANDIAESREGRKFISIDEVSAACSKVSKTQLEQLKALGALCNLPESSQMSLF